MTMKDLPSIEYLRKPLRYEPETGKLFWLDCDDMPKWWRTAWADKDAFTSLQTRGYRQGAINGKSLLAHRVAYAIYYAKWPEDEIDHINGNRQDNRIWNLRVVSRQENLQNCAIKSNNKSGVCGVYWDKRRRKWEARIGIGGRSIKLGHFSSLTDAKATRVAASKHYGFTDRHGT
jgi:hypothetical protein